MDTTPYQINYWNGHTLSQAEVKPCCLEDHVVDYAIYIENQLAFNLTKSPGRSEKWVISLKNADKEIADEIVQNIGSEIDARNRV